jgi:hypothetical protein
VRSFFNYQGFAPQLNHAGTPVPNGMLIVIPKRHPFDCYESMLARGNFDLAQFIGWWHELIFRAGQDNSFVFPIKEKDEQLEHDACEFVGIPHSPGFGWHPIGVSDRDRNKTNYQTLGRSLDFAVDWFNG